MACLLAKASADGDETNSKAKAQPITMEYRRGCSLNVLALLLGVSSKVVRRELFPGVQRKKLSSATGLLLL